MKQDKLPEALAQRGRTDVELVMRAGSFACAALLGALISASAGPVAAQAPTRGGAAKSTSAVPSARAEADALRSAAAQGRRISA